ncbi:hypothetical protein DUNSADRAFT_7093 [Dunaliella salina]|uniref:Uncharacterized protein n=1 Tax=Dunaliella salina TaxID=3046 RepID=A0ABQ7GM09_DUNSA|nr:hypothetical protein DUNSADRAFT_7093 [Dunaliella salina]|eukprot:KAF5835641.1 hypothetical protein DUNSADRAFT_7093 [Dunaliella salina]
MPTDLPPQSETAREEVKEACHLLDIHVYDPPKPLPRVPARIDGKQCLVFRSEGDRQAMVRSCKSEVERRCAMGASTTCSIQAMDKCRGPSVLRWLGFSKRSDNAVEECEHKFMEACTTDAANACRTHANTFCGESMPMAWCE